MSLTGSDVRWGRRAVSETSQPEAALGRAVIRLMERAQAISPAPLDPEVAAGLMTLELRGLVRQLVGQRYVRSS